MVRNWIVYLTQSIWNVPFFVLLIEIHENRWFWVGFSAKIRMSNGIENVVIIFPLCVMNDGRLWKLLHAIAYHNLITFILICRTAEFPLAWENGANIYWMKPLASAPRSTITCDAWKRAKLCDPLPIYCYIYIWLISILQNVWRKEIPTPKWWKHSKMNTTTISNARKIYPKTKLINE